MCFHHPTSSTFLSCSAQHGTKTPFSAAAASCGPRKGETSEMPSIPSQMPSSEGSQTGQGSISAEYAASTILLVSCITPLVTMQVLGHGCCNSSRPRLGKPCRKQQVSLTHTYSRRRQLACALAAHVNGSRTCKDIMEASTSETKFNFSYRSVFISDLHLGTPQSQAHVLLPFLQQVNIFRLLQKLSVRQSVP